MLEKDDKAKIKYRYVSVKPFTNKVWTNLTLVCLVCHFHLYDASCLHALKPIAPVQALTVRVSCLYSIYAGNARFSFYV